MRKLKRDFQALGALAAGATALGAVAFGALRSERSPSEHFRFAN